MKASTKKIVSALLSTIVSVGFTTAMTLIADKKQDETNKEMAADIAKQVLEEMKKES